MNSTNEILDGNSRTLLKRKNSDADTDEYSSDKVTGIAELQRYCSRHKLEFPCYKIIETTDFFNTKLYTVQCSVKDQREVASGKNKKEAKHKAASHLLERLKYRAINGSNDLMNENSEDSLEEGEIDDREEGEIYDISAPEKDKKEARGNEKSDVDDDDDEDDEILNNNGERKRYKLKRTYLEGNVKDNNINFVKNIVNKSQVQLLAEFCFDQKLPSPRYEISEFRGINAPIFTCQCSVLQLAMRASGKKKRNVREKSSKLLLEKMKKYSHILKSSDDKEKQIKNELEEGEITDENLNGSEYTAPQNIRKKIRMDNYSGKKPNVSVIKKNNENYTHTSMSELHSFCLKLKLPPPVYTMLDEKEVSVNKKIFSYQCSVLKFSKISYGLNKKQAKHKAAQSVLEKLKNWDHKELQENEEDLLEEGEITEHDEAVKNEYIKRKIEDNFISRDEKNTRQLEVIAECHTAIKTNKSYTESKTLNLLKKLKDTHLKKHGCLLLNQICKEMEITYDFIDFKSSIKKVTNLYLNSSPPWAVFGIGNTKEEAEINATIKILVILKNMSQ